MEGRSMPSQMDSVIYPDYISCEKYNGREIIFKSVSDKELRLIEGNQLNAFIKDHDIEKVNVDDDLDSVIIEEVDAKAIEVKDDSSEEAYLPEKQTIKGLSHHLIKNSSTSDTEYFVVSSANIAMIDIADDGYEVNRYPLENTQIKGEPSENYIADANTNDVFESDPMDLLQLSHSSECTRSSKSQREIDEYDDDVCSIGSSSVQAGSSSTLSVLVSLKGYSWLLCEEGDDLGYCLYCDVQINVKSKKSIKQHSLSLYHKERCVNYLAFREEEKRNGLSMELVEIKQEFGTNSSVEAIKLKRKSQSEALNNFNWRRWLKDYPWLQRDSSEGTIGFCKYCLIHFNVEFAYLRDRHQEAAKHKDAEKLYQESNAYHNSCSSVTAEPRKETFNHNNRSKSIKWLELLKKEPLMAQCKLCKSKMTKSNIPRHLRTNLHIQNEKVYLENCKQSNQNRLGKHSNKKKQNWKIYAQQHPWLTTDPFDPKFAYCKYCEKRVIYGNSAAKRATHENSTQHKQNENEFMERQQKETTNNLHNKNTVGKGGEQTGDDKQIDGNKGGYQEDQGQDQHQDQKGVGEEEAAEEEVEETAVNRCESEDDYMENDDDEEVEKEKENTEKEKESIVDIDSNQKIQEINQNKNKATTFEWAVSVKNNPNMYSCKYCRVRISKNYSKKQHASSKIHQINENIYKSNRRQPFNGGEDVISVFHPSGSVTQVTNILTSKKGAQTFAKVVIKAPSTVTLIKQLQKKFPWLSYKRSELRSNYGHCKICQTSLYIRSLKHVLRHLRSGRHINTARVQRKQKLENVQSENLTNNSNKMQKQELEVSSPPTQPPVNATLTNQTKSVTKASTLMHESPKAFCYKSTIEEMKKRFSWIESCNRPNYTYCRYCDTDIPLKILFLQNHSNSQMHRHNVVNYLSINSKVDEKIDNDDKACVDNNGKKSCGSNGNGDGGDVVIVEHNNDDILISEQDDNLTVKSEPMDEHDELDYNLKRSFNKMQSRKNNHRNDRNNFNADDYQPPKRVKRSQSGRLNDSNSSLVTSLLTTPLTLASCLGPFIQQQIQQAHNQQTWKGNNTTSHIQPETTTQVPDSENTYDLFFKSISETMKKLPIDLAAEGKLRVMQVICDLELQALKRLQTSQNSSEPSNACGLSYPPSSMSNDISNSEMSVPPSEQNNETNNFRANNGERCGTNSRNTSR